MADTGTCTVTNHISGSVKKIKFAWTSDASGDVEKAVTRTINGIALALVTDPGATAPTDNYDITIEDEDSIDILNGNGSDRDTSNTEQVAVDLDTGQGRPVAATSYTFKVANAGNAKVGTAWLYYR